MASPSLLLRVELPGGGTVELPIFSPCDPLSVATSFCLSHNLDSARIPALAEAIRSRAPGQIFDRLHNEAKRKENWLNERRAAQASEFLADQRVSSFSSDFPPVDRLHHRVSSRRLRSAALWEAEKSAKEAAEMKELTFHPQISAMARSLSQRSFIGSAGFHATRRSRKLLAALEADKAALGNFKPAINPVSKILARQRQNAQSARAVNSRERAIAEEPPGFPQPPPRSPEAARQSREEFLLRSQAHLERRLERFEASRPSEVFQSLNPLTGRVEAATMFSPRISQKSVKLAERREEKLRPTKEDEEIAKPQTPAIIPKSNQLIESKRSHKIAELFSLLDEDCDGFLDKKALEALRDSEGINEIDQRVLTRIMQECDEDLTQELADRGGLPSSVHWELNQEDFSSLYRAVQENFLHQGECSTRQLLEPIFQSPEDQQASTGEETFWPLIDSNSARLARLSSERSRVRALSAAQLNRQKEEIAQQIEEITKFLDTQNIQ